MGREEKNVTGHEMNLIQNFELNKAANCFTG
jgi:hypothetical protein